MVGRKKRSSRRRELLGSHQRSWIWGRNLVLETLRVGRWVPHELIVAEELEPAICDEVEELSRLLSVPCEIQPVGRLEQLCGVRDHQGLLAKMPPFPYVEIDEFLAELNERELPQLFVVLDSVQDPFNFGAICRSACAFGANGVVIGTQNQVGVTSQVARSSAGAINHLRIARVDDVPESVKLLANGGLQTLAMTLESEQTLPGTDLCKPTAIVIGNEGAGISAEVRSACTVSAMIPQASDFESLNASVAAGVCLYEAHRQRLS